MCVHVCISMSQILRRVTGAPELSALSDRCRGEKEKTSTTTLTVVSNFNPTSPHGPEVKI